jgi:hypothetical protein
MRFFLAYRAGVGISWPVAWTDEAANACLGIERVSGHREGLISPGFPR